MPDLSWEFSLAWAGAEPAKCRFTHRSVGRAALSVQWRAQKSRPWGGVERTQTSQSRLGEKQHPHRICVRHAQRSYPANANLACRCERRWLGNSGQNAPEEGARAALAQVISHDFKQPSSFPRRVLRPGFAFLASRNPHEGVAERRESYGSSET